MSFSRLTTHPQKPRFPFLQKVLWPVWHRYHSRKVTLDQRLANLRRTGLPNSSLSVSLASDAIADVLGHAPSQEATLAALQIMADRYAVCGSFQHRQQAAVIAASAMALGGTRVHLVHLSQSNAEATMQLIAPMATSLGIRAELLKDADDMTRRADVYSKDIIVASVSRLARDLLRDSVIAQGRTRGARAAVSRLAARASSEMMLRSECAKAIVLEADLMFFEAPQPVALSEEIERCRGRLMADQAFSLLAALKRGHHYSIDPSTGRVQLTENGIARVETYATLFGGPWMDKKWRVTTVLAALTVRDLFSKGADYQLEAGDIRLMRAAGDVADGPSISELIAAKEVIPVQRGELHLAGIRRLMESYGSLGATGLDPIGLDVELFLGFELKRAGRIGAVTSCLPATHFATAEDARAFLEKRLAEIGRELILWCPEKEDAEKLPGLEMDCVIGTQLFANPPRKGRIVQFGAAPLHWEERLADFFPGLSIEGIVSGEDAFFMRLPPDDPSRTTLRERPSAIHYKAAQEAASKLAHKRRVAAMASDKFFERILEFTGDLKW